MPEEQETTAARIAKHLANIDFDAYETPAEEPNPFDMMRDIDYKAIFNPANASKLAPKKIVVGKPAEYNIPPEIPQPKQPIKKSPEEISYIRGDVGDFDYTPPKKPATAPTKKTTNKKLTVEQQQFQREQKKYVHQLKFRLAKAKNELTEAKTNYAIKPDDKKAADKVIKFSDKVIELFGLLELEKSFLIQ